MGLPQEIPHEKEFLTVREASRWASAFLDSTIEESNILYLIQYGRLERHGGKNTLCVALDDLKAYYAEKRNSREHQWKEKLGDDLNWALSFEKLREKDTTRHVHRLHPYKGKFIPQLVEYFIGPHTDSFKQQACFSPGDIILDPFCGSGTTLVQAAESGLHAVGIDISSFNCMMTDVKLGTANLNSLGMAIHGIRRELAAFDATHDIAKFDAALTAKLAAYNDLNFPSADFKFRVVRGEIDETGYSLKKEKEFAAIYHAMVRDYGIRLRQDGGAAFLDRWYMACIRREIDFVHDCIKKVDDPAIRKILAVILSRTVRSCRATTHSDLATLKEPQLETYYCWKHKKICKPLFSIKGWFNRYALDTVARLRDFHAVRSASSQIVLVGDSRAANIFQEVEKKRPDFYPLLAQQKIRGIFTSPPYVGQIDYHEQHAYAYELFGFPRRDEDEIGPLFKGQGAAARQSYVDGITQVLLNCRKFLADDFDIFIVANDKYNLYPAIVSGAGMAIVNRFKRPVLNRTERDKAPYAEIIFHIRAA